MKSMKISEIINEIKDVLVNLQEDSNVINSGFNLEEVNITLKAIKTKEKGIEIPIFDTGSGGFNSGDSTVQTINLILEPETVEKPKSIEMAEEKPNIEIFAEIIKDIILEMEKSALIEPVLNLKESCVELNFIVKKEGIFSFFIKAGASSEYTNTIQIKFNIKK